MFQQRENEKQRKSSESQVTTMLLWRYFNPYHGICIVFVIFFIFLTLQTNGFSPAPMELHNVTLSRELQVGSRREDFNLEGNGGTHA